jgi:hypothetical protein
MTETVSTAPSPYREISRLRAELVAHPLYGSLHSLESVRTFMKYHVFAVWDFMSLLKALQRAVTCVEVPWMPEGNPSVRRFVNEIVLGEESDEDGRKGFLSHFELYYEAMKECGADTEPIETFLRAIRDGATVPDALRQAHVPEFVSQFVGNTMGTALSRDPHRIAAAFFYGREDVIPDMFRALVADLRRDFPELHRLIYYLDRHIEVDGDDHGPRARQIVTMLCSSNRTWHQEAVETALASLRARFALWDGVLGELSSRN